MIAQTDSTDRVRLALTRRDFLHAAGLTAAGAAFSLGSLSSDAEASTTPAEIPLIVDCHAHVYSSDESKYPTVASPYRPPAGKGTPAHLREQLAAAGVGFATAIQTSTFYGWDNRCLADTARDNADLLVGVCTLNPDDPGSPGLLERYARESNIRGLRSIPGQSGRYVDTGVEALWAAAERLGIVVTVNTGRHKRAEIEALARRHSRLKVVIDHCLYLTAGKDGQATLNDMLAGFLGCRTCMLQAVVRGDGECGKLSLCRHVRTVPKDYCRLRPRSLRVGERFPLRTLVPQGNVYPAPARLHSRAGPRRGVETLDSRGNRQAPVFLIWTQHF